MTTPNGEKAVEEIGKIFTKCFTEKARKWSEIKVDIGNVLAQEIESAERKAREEEREKLEQSIKKVHETATQNGYAMGIKHMQERLENGQDMFTALKAMKEIHRESSVLSPTPEDIDSKHGWCEKCIEAAENGSIVFPKGKCHVHPEDITRDKTKGA